jgi:LuxR family maltose regulon positive regulatory protein
VGLPRLDELVIVRPRLIALLDELPALTVVRGPIGSGKTTLAAQWAAATRRSGQTVLWLDGFVDSPRHVVAAIARAVDVDALDGVSPEEALKALTPVLRTMTDRLVVVIDAFDWVADVLGAALPTVLARCRQLHLVLCVRDSHDVVPALGTGHHLVTIDELAMTVDEVTEIAIRSGVRADDIDASDVAAVVHATGGLASLVRLGLRGSSSRGREWWAWDDVRARLREHVRDALEPGDLALVGAVVHLSAEDLELVGETMPEARQRTVAAVRRLGGVVGQHDPDRLHVWLAPLVTEAIRSLHSPLDDPDLAALHDGVIHELEDAGRVLEAVDLARRAGRQEALLDLLKRHWWDIAAHDMGVLAAALETLPEDVFGGRSVLMRNIALLIPDGVTRETLFDMDAVSHDGEELRDLAEGPDAVVHLDGIMVALMAARVGGDQVRARAEVVRGTTMATVMSRGAPHELPTAVRRFFVQAGMVHLLDLDLAGAERAFRRGYGPDEQERPDVLRREAANKLALVSALGGDHRAVRAWIDRATAIEAPQGWFAPMIETPRRLAEAVVALDRLDEDEVGRQMAELSDRGATDELWFIELFVRAARSLLWGEEHSALHAIQLARVDRAHLLGEGSLAQVLMVGAELDLLVGLGHGTRADALASQFDVTHRVRVGRGRVLVLSGRAREALAVLAAVTQTPHEFDRLRAEALLLTALAHQQLGDSEGVVTYLTRATHYSHYLAAFASAPRSLLVDHVAAVPALAPIVDALSSRIERPPYPESLVVVALTQRERHLVELLPTGSTRDAIARELFVSTNTVKTHLQALYRKLGVTSREEAVARAYELGLLG